MRFTLRPIHGLMALGIGLVVFSYPFLTEMALARWSTRSVAISFAILALLGAVVRWIFQREKNRFFLVPCGGALMLLVLAAIFEDATYLLLFPALINLLLFGLCARSLVGDRVSLVEKMARSIQPHLPDFTQSYCRKVTAMWALFFAVNVVVISALALHPNASDTDLWKLYTQQIYFGIVVVINIIEFFFRKLWFRHYNQSPIDRLLNAIFPAENTERGRRSREYVRHMHSLGYGPKKKQKSG